MIIVRKAKLGDGSKVYSLLKLLFSLPIGGGYVLERKTSLAIFREILNSKNGSILLAEEKNEVVGLITLSFPLAIHCGGFYSCIEEFFVTEQARGKGAGGQLLQAAFAEATEKGCYEIQVNGPSELGYPVYIREGFQDIGRHLKIKIPPQPYAFFPNKGFYQG